MLVFVMLQLFVGNIDTRLFAFPVGLTLGVAWTAILYVVDKEYGHRRWVASLRSPRAAYTLLALVAAFCVLGGSVPKMAGFTTSLPFVALLLALLTNILLVMFHRLHSFSIRRDTTFLAIHLGLCVALFGGMMGAGDTRETYAIVSQGEDVEKAYDKKGHSLPLGYSLRLNTFDIEKNKADGSPVQYSAGLLVDGIPRQIAVNSPLAVTFGEDIYLMNYDIKSNGTPTCVLQIVRQPWKYVTLTGIIMLLAGVTFYLTATTKGGGR
ncbi:MAG: cytochrome c biogenesis protein ResB [Prevotella sp.]